MDLSKIQFGVDVATSLAILASAITFLINQRLKTGKPSAGSSTNPCAP